MGTELEEITDWELLQQVLYDALIDLHIGVIAKVDAYDASKQIVDVTPQVDRHVPDGDGNYLPDALPKLVGVPVIFPRGGGMMFTWPIQQGDYVQLHFNDKNISNWRVGAPGDPGDVGVHTFDGAVAYAGIAPDASPLQNADANNIVIGSDSEPLSRIVIKPSGEIDLGASANGFLAMASKVLSRLSAIVGIYNTHTHPVSGAATTAPNESMATPTSVASDNAKAHG